MRREISPSVITTGQVAQISTQAATSEARKWFFHVVRATERSVRHRQWIEHGRRFVLY